MARSIRVEYAGAYYHVMARGNRRGAIFEDDEDRFFFLKTLGEACGMTGWRVHAWVLMSNHYRLLIETTEANLVDGMQGLAEHLEMGSAANASQQLKRPIKQKQLHLELKRWQILSRNVA